ncbi:MAG: HEAT repeat domain-containing protein, partial [Planctomycetaceae bacterium]|nr:HEAT repeat domain-containing protein [Planctomycetaceae bacterium]
ANKLKESLEELGTIQHEQSAQILISYLDDARASVREAAARAAGSTRQQCVFEHLAKRMSHDSVDMRAAVIHGLGLLGDKRAVEPLLALGSEDPQLSLRVAEAISSLGESALPDLISAAEANDPAMVLIAIMALARLQDPRALEVLALRTSHQSATIRAHAIEAMGKINDSKALRYLVGGLKDSQSAVRINAAVALKRLADPRTSDKLLEALNDPDVNVREQVIEALAACGDLAVVPTLLPFLQDSSPEIVMTTVEALGRLKDPQAGPQLCKLLDSPVHRQNHPLRMKLLDAVRRIKDPKALPILLGMLNNSDSSIRQKVIEAIGPVGDQSAAVELEGLLKEDRDEHVRAACARALGDIGDAESLDALEEALNDTMPVRLRAVISLGQIGSDLASISLTGLLRDQVAEIRYHAAQSLAELGDARAIRPIEVLTVDPDPMVVRGAFKALQKLGDERPEKEILKAARKRSKKATTVKSSSLPLTDFVSPVGLWHMLWPEDPEKRLIAGGVLGTVAAIILGAGVYFMLPSTKTVVPRGSALAVAFDPSGTKCLAGYSFGTLEVWDVASVNKLNDHTVDLGKINAVACVSDSNMWFTFRNQVHQFDGQSHTPLFELTNGFSSMTLSQDRKKIAITDEKGMVYVYDTATAQAVGSLDLSAYPQVAFAASGDMLAAAKGQIVRLIDLKGQDLGEISVNGEIKALAFAPDDSALLIAHSDDGSLTSINPADMAVQKTSRFDEARNPLAMRFSDSGELVLFGLSNSTGEGIGICNLEEESVQLLKGSPNLLPAAWSSEAKQMAAVLEDDSAIVLYDLKANAQQRLDI